MDSRPSEHVANQPVHLTGKSNDLIIWPGVEKLTLISGDRTVMDSSELLSSEMMAKLVQEGTAQSQG